MVCVRTRLSPPHMKLQAFPILLLLGHCLGSVVKRQSHEEELTTVENERESGMVKVNFGYRVTVSLVYSDIG